MTAGEFCVPNSWIIPWDELDQARAAWANRPVAPKVEKPAPDAPRQAGLTDWYK